MAYKLLLRGLDGVSVGDSAGFDDQTSAFNEIGHMAMALRVGETIALIGPDEREIFVLRCERRHGSGFGAMPLGTRP